ncbi:unnamed protein product [Pipistrellus nathusii]|uniref:Uncharacterized protein n=1 Tax=Pipistrellus nathusii TaxID=59473 RepID=A0ABP0A465_PIPNA
MNTCDAIMERTIFVFSLASSSFSLRQGSETITGPTSSAGLGGARLFSRSGLGPRRPSGASPRLEGGEAVDPDPAASRGAAHRPRGHQTSESLPPPSSPRSLILSPSTCEHSFNELG